MYPAPEILYGGAAGGGKSDAMLMAALQYVHVPDYSALILRRTYPQLSQEGGLIPRSHDWLSGRAEWNEQRKTWRFPSGAVLAFGHLQYENTKYDYQSGEYQFIGFEELTQFTETQYLYMHSRTRRLEGSDVPIRIRATSNPGGVGHLWVYDRFIVGSHPERAFIPAKLEDNPSLDIEEYERSLEHLDPTTRRQLRDGDWTARADGAFGNVTLREITKAERERFDRIYHGVDWGWYPDPWLFVSVAHEAAQKRIYVFREMSGVKLSNDETARRVLDTVGSESVLCDSAEPKSIRDYRSHGIDAFPATKGKGSVDYGVKWMQSLAEIVIDPVACPLAAREFAAWPVDMPDEDNHSIDGVRYALNKPIMSGR